MLVRHLPPGNALERERDGVKALWQLEHYLLAAAVDALNGANWQRGGDKNTPRPAPVPRPGLPQGDRVDREHAVTVEEANARLGW